MFADFSLYLRGLVCPCLVFFLGASVDSIQAQNAIENEIARIKSANQVILLRADEKLKNEKRLLDKIRQLRNDGHASWLELARQQLVVDELTAQRISLLDFTKFVASLENKLAQNPKAQPPIVVDYTSADLQQLTLRLAKAKAHATGRLSRANIELLRQRARIAAIKKMHVEGFASARSLKKSREAVTQSVDLFNFEQERLQNLKQVVGKLESLLSIQTSTHASKKSLDPRIDANFAWPCRILQDAVALKKLIDLRRQYYDSQGQHNALQQKLEMRKNYLKKLPKQISQPTPSSNDWAYSRSLATGQQRQRETLKLDILHLQASIQDFAEKLTIIALTEKKLIVERLLSGPLEANQALVTVDTKSRSQYFKFTINERQHPVLLPCYRSPVNLSTMNQRMSSPTARQHIQRVSKMHDPKKLQSKLNRRPTRYRTYSTQDIYPFGILRADLRNRIPAGFAPWYLPGSPTNLQSRPVALSFFELAD